MSKMKIKRQLKTHIYFFLIIIMSIVSFLIILFLNDYRKNELLLFEKNNLSDVSLKYTENGKYDIELLKSEDNNLIYGTIFDSSKNGNLFLTKGIYTFNLYTDEFTYYENLDNNRIVDFYIKNNILYKVVLKNTTNGNYCWEVISQQLFTNEEKIIVKGCVVNIFNYPRLFSYNNNLYLIAISDNGEDYSKEIYAFYQLSNTFEENEKLLFSYEGSTITDDGILSYNIANNKIYLDNLYFTIVDEKHIQYLVKLNLKTLEKNVVEENKEENKILQSYVPTKSGIYIQYIFKNKSQKSILKYHFNNGKINTLQSNINTFENSINNDNLLFHNEGNNWLLYNTKENKISLLNTNIDSLDLYPKYLVVSKNKIIVQDFNNNFYTGLLNF